MHHLRLFAALCSLALMGSWVGIPRTFAEEPPATTQPTFVFRSAPFASGDYAAFRLNTATGDTWYISATTNQWT